MSSRSERIEKMKELAKEHKKVVEQRNKVSIERKRKRQEEVKHHNQKVIESLKRGDRKYTFKDIIPE